MRFFLPVVILFLTACGSNDLRDYEAVPEEMRIGFPDWVADIGITYSFREREREEPDPGDRTPGRMPMSAGRKTLLDGDASEGE